jgi:PEP-CTERM motif
MRYTPLAVSVGVIATSAILTVRPSQATAIDFTRGSSLLEASPRTWHVVSPPASITSISSTNNTDGPNPLLYARPKWHSKDPSPRLPVLAGVPEPHALLLMGIALIAVSSTFRARARRQRYEEPGVRAQYALVRTPSPHRANVGAPRGRVVARREGDDGQRASRSSEREALGAPQA